MTSLKIGAFFCQTLGEYLRSPRNIVLNLSPKYLEGGAETNSDPDPLLREKLDPDLLQIRKKTRISRSAPDPLPPLSGRHDGRSIY